jgi:hypothetical protein
VTLTYAAHSSGPPERAWDLIARPDRWARWAPHVRGAWNLGAPEVEAGCRGAVRLLGLVPVPATITGKRPGRSWSWRVGAVDMTHRVEPAGGGCDVVVELSAPAALETLLRATYGPAVGLLVRNLARVAGERSPGA